MHVLFILLLILALLLLVVSVIKPSINKKTSKPYKRKDMLIGFGIAVIVFAVLTGVTAPKVKSNSAASSQHTKTTQSTKSVAATSTTTPTQPSGPVLSGYGATGAEWNKTHTEDRNFTSNTSYDPDPQVTASCNGVKYCAVNWGSRVLDYSMGFPNNESQDTVEASVMQEFPTDTTIVWQQKNTSGEPNECYQMEVYSSTLATVLSADGGYVSVEFSTTESSDSSGNIDYKASDVNTVIISPTESTIASDAAGC